MPIENKIQDTYSSLLTKYPEVIGVDDVAKILCINRKTVTDDPKIKSLLFRTGNRYKASLWKIAKYIDGR